eukprot:scaffold15.g4257.t1
MLQRLPVRAQALLASAREALAPIATVAAPLVDSLRPAVSPALAVALPRLQHAATAVNQRLQSVEAWQLVLLTAVATLLLARAWRALRAAQRTWADKGWRQVGWGVASSRVVSGFVADLPGVRGVVRREQEKLVAKIRADLLAKGGSGAAPLRALPREASGGAGGGTTAAEVKQRLRYKEQEDVRFQDGDSHLSGTVYMAGSVHKALLNEVYNMFSLTNPMHADVFPSVRKMEGEVVAMTASLLGGGPGGDPGVCGTMTSGGTESILSAVKAARDYMAATRGVRRPEMAAEYFGIRLVRLPVGADHRLSPRAVAAALTRNTVLAVASAPSFPHGVVDHVGGIAAACAARGVPLHVDCCLGGFVLPFARRLGYPVPPFDFSVPGVTSISVDTHKFGMAHKGTSVVLYRSKEISAAKQFQQGVAEIEGLEVMGAPEMCVVAIKSTRSDLDIYRVNDLLSKRGWHLNALQRPAAVHICFTAAHSAAAVECLLRDLREAVAQVLADPKGGGEGSAPLYGMAAVIPDRRIVAHFLQAGFDAAPPRAACTASIAGPRTPALGAYQDTLLEAA